MSGCDNAMMECGTTERRRYEVVLFDVSGVLVDLSGGPSSLLPDVTDPWSVWGRSRAVRRFETGKSSPSQFTHEMVNEHELTMKPAQLYAEFASWPLGVYRGARGLIEALRGAGIRVATLTNTNAIHWPYIVESLGLGELIEHHFVSYQMGVRKPERQAFERVADYFDCLPSQIFFLDDRETNVRAARRLGCSGVTVNGIHEAEAALHSIGLVSNSGKAISS